MARITAIGGIFMRSPDGKALAAWYRDVLGLDVQDWGGALIPLDATPPRAVWSPFAEDTTHFAPSTREFMINFAVDDLDGMLARIAQRGVTILSQEDSDSF